MVKRAAVIVSLLILAACSSSSARQGFADTASEPVSPPPEDQTTESAPLPASNPPPNDTTPPDQDPPSDCKTAPPSNKCGVVPQCGCATSETCDVVDSQGNARCVPWGKAPMGHPCTATAGCAQGLTCVFGTCHAFCDQPGKACGIAGTGACVGVQASGGAAIPNLNVCMVQCAPESATSCGGKTNAGIGACVLDDKGQTDCEEGGTRAEKQTCGGTNGACGPGLVCTTPSSGSSTCKRWCKVGTADCGGTTQCSGFSTKVMVGTVEYGACP